MTPIGFYHYRIDVHKVSCKSSGTKAMRGTETSGDKPRSRQTDTQTDMQLCYNRIDITQLGRSA